MLRIDENTYIDDTLVTCAEYQLFIDEMREQGKYFQPDHWASHHFPSGQARAPILGVRRSDAKSFCVWLTQREAGEWCYRLPTSDEAAEGTLLPIAISPFGYWVEGEMKFVWVGTVPINPHAYELALDRARKHALNLDRAPDRVSALLDINDLARKEAFEHAIDIEHTIDLALVFFRDLDREHHDPFRDFDQVDASNLYRACCDRAVALNYHDSGTFFHRSLNYGRARAINEAIGLAYGQDFYIDLFTLLERIAGRSPAFEGIRIVKERVK